MGSLIKVNDWLTKNRSEFAPVKLAELCGKTYEKNASARMLQSFIQKVIYFHPFFIVYRSSVLRRVKKKMPPFPVAFCFSYYQVRNCIPSRIAASVPQKF